MDELLERIAIALESLAESQRELVAMSKQMTADHRRALEEKRPKGPDA